MTKARDQLVMRLQDHRALSGTVRAFRNRSTAKR